MQKRSVQVLFFITLKRTIFALRKINQKLIGSLYDSENKLLHYFYIYQKNGKYNSVYSDSYVQDIKVDVNDENILPVNHENITVEKIEDLHYNLNLFYKDKSREIKILIDIISEKSDFNYFQIDFDYPNTSTISSILKDELKKEQCFY